MTEPAAAGEETRSRGSGSSMSRWADCCILVVR